MGNVGKPFSCAARLLLYQEAFMKIKFLNPTQIFKLGAKLLVIVRRVLLKYVHRRVAKRETFDDFRKTFFFYSCQAK